MEQNNYSNLKYARPHTLCILVFCGGDWEIETLWTWTKTNNISGNNNNKIKTCLKYIAVDFNAYACYCKLNQESRSFYFRFLTLKGYKLTSK